MNVSVVIITHNRRQLLPRAFASLAAQTEKPAQVIVVDDGSTDGTADWLRATQPHVEVLRHETNRGIPAARNTGLAQARHEVVAWLDSDDAWEREYLRLVMAAWRKRQDMVLAYTFYILESDVGALAPTPVGPKPRSGNVLQAMVVDNCIHTCSAMTVKRDAAREAGGFDESVRSCSDWGLYLRVLATAGGKSSPLGCIATPLVRRFFGRDNVVHRTGQWYEDAVAILDGFIKSQEGAACRPLREPALARLRQVVESHDQFMGQLRANQPTPPDSH